MMPKNAQSAVGGATSLANPNCVPPLMEVPPLAQPLQQLVQPQQ
jgi:hypothetical protein